MNWSKGYTVKEKILLHLLAYAQYSDSAEVPEAVTQQGIADTIFAPRPHVSMALKDFRSQEKMIERTCHVKGGKRRQRVYFLTTTGIQLAASLKNQLFESRIKVITPLGEQSQTFAQVYSIKKIVLFELLDMISPNGILDLTKPKKQIKQVKPDEALETIEKLQILNTQPPSDKKTLAISNLSAPQSVLTTGDAQEDREQSRGYRTNPDYNNQYFKRQYPAQHSSYPGYPDYPSPYPYQYYPGQPLLVISEKMGAFLFSIGYVLLIIGVLSSLYLLESGMLLYIIPMIIFLILGVSIMAFSSEVLWVKILWQKRILNLLIITIPIMLYIMFFAAIEPGIYYPDLGLWLIIIFSFLAFANFSTFIPLINRAQILGALGIIILLNAPFALVFNALGIFETGFWLMIGVLCIYIGNDLLSEEEKVENIAPGLLSGLGIGIITVIIYFSLTFDFQMVTGFGFSIYGILILWSLVAMVLLYHGIRMDSKTAVVSLTRLHLAIPLYFGIILLFFCIVLIRFEKIIETMVELFLSVVLMIYGIKRLSGQRFFELFHVGAIGVAFTLTLAYGLFI